MSEPPENNNGESTEGIPLIKPIPQKDWFLQSLVNLVNTAQGTTTISLTIFSKGIILSGNLINGMTYFEEQSEIWAEATVRAGVDNTIEDGRKLFTDIAEAVYGPMVQAEPGEYEDPYIHMKVLRVYMGNSPLESGQNGGFLWRGRISEVDGFTLGTMV